MKVRWDKYFQKTKDRPPRDLLVKAVDYVGHIDKALDLGAGALMDTKYLLARDFSEVIAVDSDEAFPEFASQIQVDRFVFMNTNLLTFNFGLEGFDLINAQRVLPYLSINDFEDALKYIRSALKQGGVFTGIFFGDKDEQILPGSVEMTRLSVNDLKRYFSDFEILKLEETEEDKESTMGVKKHFHEIGIIAKKS